VLSIMTCDNVTCQASVTAMCQVNVIVCVGVL